MLPQLALTLMSVCSWSVASMAQPEVADAGRQSDNLERHVVERGTSVWFGKSKNKILDYAAVTTKVGIVETDHRTKRDYEEDTTGYKLSVIVNAADSSTASVEAKVREVAQYRETSSTFDILVEVKTGIEGSTTRQLHSWKTLSATIVTSLNTEERWTLKLETEVDNRNSIRHRQGLLGSNDRSIDIIDNRFPLHGAGPAVGLGIEFIEKGKLLGVIGDGTYLFNEDLDPELKLVLAAAMEAVNFRYRH